MSNIAETARIYPNVVIEEGAEIGEFCIIGLPPKGKAPGELETRIGANAVIRSHTVIYAGNSIGDNFNSGHGALVREDNQIGRDVSIGSHTVIEHHLEIQDGVRIHSQVFVPEFTDPSLENAAVDANGQVAQAEVEQRLVGQVCPVWRHGRRRHGRILLSKATACLETTEPRSVPSLGLAFRGY